MDSAIDQIEVITRGTNGILLQALKHGTTKPRWKSSEQLQSGNISQFDSDSASVRL